MDRFANWCRSLRGNYPRNGWAEKYGLRDRSLQDLEQGRALPSRALVVLLKAIEEDPQWMWEVARRARPELRALDELRASRK
jgi:hypothetical protein